MRREDHPDRAPGGAGSATAGLSPAVLDHFMNPRNVGEIPDADGVGTHGDPACGDFLKIWIKVRDNRISKITFKCRGCPAAIACGSVVTELALNRDLNEAADITDETVAEALGGLPGQKLHCSNLAAEALQNAILDHIVRWVSKRRSAV